MLQRSPKYLLNFFPPSPGHPTSHPVFSLPPPTNQEDIPGRWTHLKGTSCPYSASTPQVNSSTSILSQLQHVSATEEGVSTGLTKTSESVWYRSRGREISGNFICTHSSQLLWLAEGIHTFCWAGCRYHRAEEGRNRSYIRTAPTSVTQGYTAGKETSRHFSLHCHKFSKSTFFKDSSAITKQEAPQKHSLASKYFWYHDITTTRWLAVTHRSLRK